MQNKGICQQPNQRPIVAAFDFDGTITTRDSLLVFFWHSSGVFKTIFKLIQHVPLYIAYFFNLKTRQQVKEGLIKSFFQGMLIQDVRKEGKKFAEGALNNMIKKEALEKIKYHQNLNHRCILVSANLDVYLEEFCKLYEFHDCLCSKVAVDSENKVTGYLEGLNCRGEEKVRRLEALLGGKDGYMLYAYGDSDGDKEMLEMADYPFYRAF